MNQRIEGKISLYTTLSKGEKGKKKDERRSELSERQ